MAQEGGIKRETATAIALFAIMLLGAMPAIGQGANPGAEHNGRTKHNANTGKPSHSAPSVVRKGTSTPSLNDDEQEKSLDAQGPVKIAELPSVSITRDWVDWVAWGANILLVVGGLIGLIVSVRTLRNIERQTNAAVTAAQAAEDGAKATLKQAEALFREQRAWLLIEDIHLGQVLNAHTRTATTLACCIKNYGKTPAFVRAMDIQLDIGDSDLTPPRLEIFDVPPFEVNEHIIPQEDRRPHTVLLRPDGILTHEQMTDIETKRLVLWACGCLKYRDINELQHETRICYFYDPVLMAFQLGGPPECNNAT